jgi:hypothetical protein
LGNTSNNNKINGSTDMKNFILSILTADSKLSSKRFISLFSLLLLAGVVITSLTGVKVDDIVYYTLSGLILGGSAMTLITNKNTSSRKT